MSNQSNISCKHFEDCGGCSLQHLSKPDYYQYKQDILNNIIVELGIDQEAVKPIIEVGEKSRRRADFKISVSKNDIKIGFFTAKSHDVVDIQDCLVSENKLVDLLEPLRDCLKQMKKPGVLASISVTILDNGIDAIISTRSDLNNADKEKLIHFAKENEIISLTDGEKTLYKSAEPKINFAGVEVELPVGAFLQATQKGQDAITEFVVNGLEGCSHIADLYSGCGTYSFPMAALVKTISAFEGDEQMVSAMYNAVVRSGLDSKITATTRDLFSRPLKGHELKQFDGVVINPPRNGALPQVRNIAEAGVKKVVMVSCNPQTFKRDAKCLIDDGYEVTKAQAIDQFYWSDHLEVVAVFAK